MPITGEFQVRDGESLLSSGVITSSDDTLLETDQHTKKGSVLEGKPDTEVINVNEVYRELILRGYEYGPFFQGIRRASVDSRDTDIRWDGRWISYLDTVLQMCLLSRPGTHQSLPVLLESVIIDPRVHPAQPAEGTEEFETIPGSWDPVLDIVAAGGVEIRGSHTIRSSRRLTHNSPNVEEYTFAPYMDPSPSERSAPVVSKALMNYSDACFEFSRQGMKRWLAEDKDNLLPNKQEIVEALEMANKIASTPETASNYASAKATLEALVKSKNGHGLPNHGVFEMLDMTFSEPLQGDYWETLRKKLHVVRSYLWDDPIIAAMESPDIIKFVLETVADNVPQQVVEILEVGAARGSYYRQAIPKALDYLSVKDWRYTIADKFFVEDAVDYPVKILQFDPLDPANFPEAQNESCDLLVLKWTLHMEVDLDEAITGFSKMIKPGGFLLVEENVERLPTLFPIKAIVSASLGGHGGPEGDRSFGCFYTDAQWTAFFKRHGFEQVMHRHDGFSASLFLLRKPLVPITPPVIVNVDDLQCSWLEEVQARCAELRDSPKDARLWLVAKTELSGILGFFRSLTWEVGIDKLRCIQICDSSPGSKLPEITADSADFKELVRKDMAYNIYKNGKWGSYRGFVVPEAVRQKERESNFVYADWLSAGDISSLHWFNSPLKIGHHNGMLGSKLAQQLETETCYIYYAGLNLRDVMLANGTIQRDILPDETFFKEGVLGIEFSGRKSSGKRVMGLCPPPALASSVQCPVSSLWTVPDHWTLEEAATVPLAYATAYYCLVVVGGLQKGKTVFIHAGTSTVGQGPEWTQLYDLVQTGIQSGVVKPLKRAVFGMDKIVDAFKTVEAQKETAKVLVKIRDEEAQKLCQTPKTSFSAVHRTCFDPTKSYVLVGGMGGMGLETAHWMVLRGAKKILLTSRSGIRTGYQARKISFLRQLGVDIEVLAISLNNRKSADELLQHALKMGPVGGIFNIATALHDDNFSDFTRDVFVKALDSKVTTSLLLDEISREKPVRDTLDHFVMYSSIVASHGHMGQTNYAFGNSVLEKICERRKRDGLPATVPQWASIADVGIVAQMGNQVIITRKFPQRFFNVLNVFDYMMSSAAVVTTSYVLIERSMIAAGGEESMVDQVLKAVGKILGIKNVSTVDGDKEFIDMGVDSLMSVEIKQALERDVDLVISTKDIQLMTFNGLKSLIEGN
ncbi:fatty acid synthase-like [Elysia marginata]|uniref:Fatty acid synthase-like n=1 Tax=Elysia marginata TaxID=1093978 RepID=A0AAV4G992_9GAST|nr:fatty acid synthase-like [Elysia marginata]